MIKTSSWEKKPELGHGRNNSIPAIPDILVDHHSDQGYDTESRSDFSVFSAGQLLQDHTRSRLLDQRYIDADDTGSVHSLPAEFSRGHCLEIPPIDPPIGRKDSYTSPLKRYQEQLNQKTIGYPHTGIDKAHLDSFVDRKNGSKVNVRKFISSLDKTGINVFKDPRFSVLLDALTAERSVTDTDKIPILKSLPIEEFEQICRPSASLINQALSDQLIIPDFGSFSTIIRELYQECKSITSGAVSDHIHQLARVPGDQWAVSICTVDGQRVSFGNHHHIFSLQSLRDVLVYALAISECGEETVHGYVRNTGP